MKMKQHRRGSRHIGKGAADRIGPAISRRACAALAAVLVLAAAAAPARAFRHISRWKESFKTSGFAGLLLSNTFGSVEVTGWDRDVIEVAAEVRIKAPSRAAAERIGREIEFGTDFDGDTLRIEALLPRIRMAGLRGEAATSVSIRYSIMVPVRTGVSVETVSGGITVEGVEGGFDLVCGDGPVFLRSPGGEGLIDAGDGEVMCVIMSFPAGGSLEIRASGPVTLGIPPETGAFLDAETSLGETEVGLEMSDVRESGRRLVRGVLGDGAGHIEIRSYGGDIYVGPAGTPRR